MTTPGDVDPFGGVIDRDLTPAAPLEEEKPVPIEEEKPEPIEAETPAPIEEEDQIELPKLVEKELPPAPTTETIGREAMEEILTEQDPEQRVINADGLSDEELDALVEKLNNEANDAGNPLIFKKSPEYLKMKRGLQYAKDQIDVLTEQSEQSAAKLEERMEKMRALEGDYDAMQEDLNRVAPYVEVLQENEHLRSTLANLIRSNKVKDTDTEKQGVYKDKAIDSAYSFLEELTGVDLRGLVDGQLKQKRDSLKRSSEDGNDAVVRQKQSMTMVDQAIHNALGGL